MMSDLTLKFKDDINSEACNSKFDSIKKMKLDGTWFTDLEFQVCSNLYGFPIIIFSISNKMMYFDTLIAPEGQNNNYKCPLYVLQHSNHFTALIHRK